MAVVAVTFIGTKVFSADAFNDGNWLDEVGTFSGAANTDIQIEGTQCVSDQVSASTKAAYAIAIAEWTGEPWNFSSAGANFGDHIYGWMNILGTPAALSAGGFRILAADDQATDSRGTWYVGPQSGWTGGWNSFVANPAQAFDTVTAGTSVWTTGGNPGQLTGVDGFGIGWSVSSTFMGANDNCFFDAISVGQGYRLTGGDGGDADGTFANFITYEETSTNRYGALRSASGALLAKGKLRIGGTGAENTVFTDSGFTVIWEGVLNSVGTLGVASDLYALHLDKNTGTTDVSLSNGSLSAASPSEVYLDFRGVTSVAIANLTVQRARLIDLDGAVSWTGGSIISSGMMDLGGAPTFTSIGFTSPTDPIALKIDDSTEIANVSDISFSGAGIGGNGSAAIMLTKAGSYDFDNITFASRVTGSTDVLVPFGADGATIINVLNNGDTPTVRDESQLDNIMDDWQQFVDSRAQTISVVAAARTYTRSAGSFLTDGPDRRGFFPGQTVHFTGFTNAGNNGPKVIQSVTATVITVLSSTGLVNETGNADERAFQYRNDPVPTFPFTPVVVNNAVTLEITNVVVGSHVAIIADSGGVEAAGTILLNTTAVSSTVSTGYNYQGTQPIIVRVRRSQSGFTRYYPINTGGVISSTGFSLRIEQIVDTIAAP